MTFITRRTRVLSAAALAVVVAACGGAAPSTAPSQAAATQSAAPTAAAATPVATATPAAPTASATPSSSATGTTAPAASGDGQPTTGRIEIPDKGFAVTLPAGWTRIDLSSSDLQSIIEAAGSANPELAQTYAAQIQAMLASGLVLFALGPGPGAGTNLNVLQIPGAGLSLDLLESINTTQIEALANGAVDVERVQLPAGEAVHYRYALPAQGLPAPASIDQYMLVGGSNVFVVSITGGTEADAKAIAESVELLD